MKNTIVFAIKNGKAMSLYLDLDSEIRSICDIDDNERYFDENHFDDMVVFSDVKLSWASDYPVKSNDDLKDLDFGIYIFGGDISPSGNTYHSHYRRYCLEVTELHLSGELFPVDFRNENHIKLMKKI